MKVKDLCWNWDGLSHINRLKTVCILYKSLESFLPFAIWFWDIISQLYADINNESS